jgi:predicted alpha/beta superfamily hydrolase
MRNTLIAAALIAAALLFACQESEEKTIATQKDEDEEVKPDILSNSSFQIPSTEVRLIKSSVKKQEYKLYVKLPPSYHEDVLKLYPVLILTDADYAFPLVSSISKRLIHAGLTQEFIIVGISYAVGDDPGISRTRDYTPTYSPNEKQGFSQAAKEASGHADEFLNFLGTELITFLTKNYQIDTRHKALAGHSFGGLLTAYGAITHPEYFEYYFSGSPSLWYDDNALFRIEKKTFNKTLDLDTKIFFAIGSMEDDKNFHPMVTQMKSFEETLLSRKYQNLRIQSQVIPNEDHFTVYPGFITKGIIWAFGQ